MLMMVNIDNVAGDILPYLIDHLLDLGANNVHVIQALTKKGRLGYLFLIDTNEEYLDVIAEFLAQETGTLGVRILENRHRPSQYTLQQVCLTFEGGPETPCSPYEVLIDVKLVANENSEIISARAEYRQIEAACKELDRRGCSVSFLELKARAELAALEVDSRQANHVSVKAIKFETKA